MVGIALLFTQQAAQLHGLGHLGMDLVRIGRGEGNLPPLSHPAEQCIALHAVDGVLPAFALALEPPHLAAPAPAPFSLPLPFSPRIEFDSRAPPVLS